MLFISNFVLELSNIKNMKRHWIIFLVVALVIVSTAFLFFSSGFELSKTDYVHFGIIGFLVAAAVFIAIKKMRNMRRGEPQEDELSKKLMQKASSLSYFVSLYIWVVILYLKDRVSMDTEELIGSGILAMGVVWTISMAFYYFRGIRNE